MCEQNPTTKAGRELKIAAEVLANAKKEISRQAKGQAIIPIATKEEQKIYAFIYVLYAPWYENCTLQRTK